MLSVNELNCDEILMDAVGFLWTQYRVLVGAVQINQPFSVDMDGLSRGASAGDYLVKDFNGQVFPCDRNHFETHFQMV